MQDIAAEFYSIDEFARPQTEDEFVIWSYRLATQYVQQRRYGSHKEIPLPALRSEFSEVESETQFHASEIGWHHQRPTQFLTVMANELLRNIKKLPPDMQRICYRLIDSGDITEYAKDHDVSLFDAMKEIKHSRAVMRRILDDETDEKKFSAGP